MKKTLKALYKWINGDYMEPSEMRRVDTLLFEIQCGFITLLIVLIILGILDLFGCFEGTPMYELNK